MEVENIMGRQFFWFTGYEIKSNNEPFGISELILKNEHSVSHSYGNSRLITDYFNTRFQYTFPTIPDRLQLGSDDFDLSELISPKIMKELCEVVLQDNYINNPLLKDRFNRFKELSEQGYYIAYERY